MAMKRFPCEQYATLELNQVAFPKTGMVVSQTPLGDAFTADAPCENGMWLVADKSKGYLAAPAAATDSPIGIVYTAEKEYDMYHYGLKTFGRKVAGDYPRVGIFGLGDTVTTNCFQYNDAEFEDDQDDPEGSALEEALEAWATTPVYVIPGVVAGSVNKAIPQVTGSKPGSGLYGVVTKYYTVPNGEKAIKYQIVSLG